MNRYAKWALNVVVILIGIVVVGWSGEYGYALWRNYQGYCEKDDRKWTTKERLDIALADLLVNQELMGLLEIGKAERSGTPPIRILREAYFVIPYESKSEFLEVNPGCCALTWLLPEGRSIDWQERAHNSGDGFFRVNYVIRYKDSLGNIKTLPAKHTYYQVNNCGYPRFLVTW